MAKLIPNRRGVRIDGSFRFLADSLPQLVWLAGPGGACEFVNRRWCEYTGLTQEEAAGNGWEAVIHPDDLAATLQRWEAALATGEPGEFEERWRRHDGAYRSFLIRFEPCRDADGKTRCWFGTATDIEAQKRKGEARQLLSEERYRRLVEAAYDGIAEIDLEGRITYANDRLATMLGYLPEDLPGRTVLDFTFPADHAAAREHIAQRSRGARQTFEWRWRHRDGSEVWTLAGAAPLFDADGQPFGAVGIFSDLTARRAAIEKLRASEERFRTSVDCLLDCFGIFTAVRSARGEITDFCVEYVNDAVCAANQAARHEMIGRGLLELRPAHADNGLFDAYCRVVESGEPLIREMEFVRGEFGGQQSGQWLDIRATRLGDGFVVAWRDVTERKLAEEALRDASQRKDAFLAVLAHELRNPLAPVRNAAGVLARVGPEDEPRFRQATRVIERQVAHMARLTDDLLDVSRIARGGVRLRTETIDLNAIVHETTEDYRDTLETEAGLRVQVELPAPALWVRGDAVRLAQAVGNLLHNAAKFTAAGGTVRVRLRVAHPYAVLDVTDTGRGMTPDMLARLFEPFSQADDSLDRGAGGLGLGLALVKGLVELHEGSVEATSEGPGKGSTFTVELPLADAPGDIDESAPAGTRRRGGLGILVIEDNADAAASLAMLLQLDGHRVTVAGNGPEGLEAAHKERPDVVLCDIGLPGGMDGYAIARAVRADPELAAMKLIAVTGYGQDDDRQRTREAGFDRHVLKPIDFKELSRILYPNA